MCLAESLLRSPDARTCDPLIRDTVGRGDWKTHVCCCLSLFGNAAAWGLPVTSNIDTRKQISFPVAAA
jgi:RHH-type proline utilization regulon transcriptional repressor/proline dehydrogenase/delta 1-pyrroline-5-carboxylate dehydrogenase